MVFAFSGATAVHAGDPVPIPQSDTPEPTVPPPTQPPPTQPPPTQPPPTQPPPTQPPATVVVEVTPVVVVTQPPAPTNTPVPPTATPAPQQVVAGVQALPRTGAGAESAGVNSTLLALGGLLFAASAATAGFAWRTSKAG